MSTAKINQVRRYWLGIGASTRIANVLTRAGIESIDALRAAGPAAVIRLRGIGGRSMIEIAGIAGWASILAVAAPVTVAKMERALEQEA